LSSKINVVGSHGFFEEERKERQKGEKDNCYKKLQFLKR
jgi:hypothetical protein